MKLDVLALRNLDMAADAIALIEEQTGERIDLAGIPDGSDTTDPRVQATWRLLQDGRTAGVFQMESAPMAQLARDVRPTHIDDLSAVIALYRPGPLSAGMHTMYAARKNGLEPVDYDWLTDDPDEQRLIASVLEETYGLIVYQEQMMQLSAWSPASTRRNDRSCARRSGRSSRIRWPKSGRCCLTEPSRSSATTAVR